MKDKAGIWSSRREEEMGKGKKEEVKEKKRMRDGG